MEQGYQTLGFVVIVVLYATIGLLAATGFVFLARRWFAPKGEQVFYALFLILVAAFYLAFAAYFHAPAAAWKVEGAVVLTFAVMGLAATRLPLVLMAGYALHGVWDLLHEVAAHVGSSAFEPGQLTAIPLAYGVFCVAFDFAMAAYSYTRRGEWAAAWK
jgi:hypothetical protein